MQIKNIIFDLGGVLIDWNPMYVYQKIFKKREDAETFLKNICSLEWNEAQDGGRSMVDGTNILIQEHPQWEKEIRIYYDHWEQMLGGPIYGTVDLLLELKNNSQNHVFGLTNWSAELFPIALKKYEFLNIFEDIIVSGAVKLKKPDPEIYKLLLEKHKLTSSETLFIDDNKRNIDAAEKLGIITHHFVNNRVLQKFLIENSLI